MKKLCLISYLLLLYLTAASQNLIPNGDFENYSICPTLDGQIHRAIPWFEPTGLNQTSDYFNVCSPLGAVSVPSHSLGNGYQYPHSGNGHSGMYLYHMSTLNLRESIEVQTTSPLVAGQCYNFTMYINIFNRCRYTTDAIGVYFSNTPVNGVQYPGIVPFTPQLVNATGNMPDTLTWLPVTGTYTAAGGENYIVIGNFSPDSSTTLVTVNATAGQYVYCYVDDVSLVPCSPSATGELTVDEIIIFPNPVTDMLHIQLPGITGNCTSIDVFNVLGQPVLKNTKPVYKNNTCSIPVVSLPRGVYFIKINYANKTLSAKFVKQ